MTAKQTSMNGRPLEPGDALYAPVDGAERRCYYVAPDGERAALRCPELGSDYGIVYAAPSQCYKITS